MEILASALQQGKSSSVRSDLRCVQPSQAAIAPGRREPLWWDPVVLRPFWAEAGNDSTAGGDRLKPATFEVRLVRYVRHA